MKLKIRSGFWEKIEINRFFKEGNSDENPWEEISREEYEDRKNRKMIL